jgi:hypothetical protein
MTASSFFLDELREELPHPRPRPIERAAAPRRRDVEPPAPARLAPGPGAQVPPPLEPVEERIERAGAEPVAVARELRRDPGPEDGLLRRVVEDVKPDEPEVERRVPHDNIEFRYYRHRRRRSRRSERLVAIVRLFG